MCGDGRALSRCTHDFLELRETCECAFGVRLASSFHHRGPKKKVKSSTAGISQAFSRWAFTSYVL